MSHRAIFRAFSALLLTSILGGCGGGSSTPSTSTDEQTTSNPVPTLTSLSIDSAVLGSDDLNVTISGKDFVAGAKVSFGASELTPAGTTVNQLTLVVPKSVFTTVGVLPVTASNPSPGGGKSNALSFTVKYPIPTLTALSLSSTLVGTPDLELKLDGTGFTSAARVRFGSGNLSPTVIANTQLSVVVPSTLLAAAGTVVVTVSNPEPGGGASNELQFTVNNPVPTLTALSVSKTILRTIDLQLDLSGKGFASGARVQFGSQELVPASISDTQLSIVVPSALLATAGVLPVTLANPEPGGGKSNALEFTVENPVPTLTALSVSSTLVGSSDLALNIDGAGFISGARVHFGSQELAPLSVAETQISVLVPSAMLSTASIVAVTVSNVEPVGGISNGLEFSINNPVPVITALSVDNAEAGTEADLALSITGTNFVSGATVDFGSHRLNPGSVANSDRLDITVPMADLATGGAVSVVVTNPGPGGGPSSPAVFTIKNPVPQLTALSQLAVTAGGSAFELEVVGAKFVSTTSFDFGGVSLTPASITKGSMVVTIPETAFETGAVIQVKALSPEPGGGPSNTIEFTINNPVPAIAAVAPISITNTGSDVVVHLTGSNFVSSSTVTAGGQSASSSRISKTDLQVTLPAATVAAAAGVGSLTFSVSNPSPSGGASNDYSIIVHNKASLGWQTVANGATAMPGTKSTTLFNVFGPVSVNDNGLAVFKGQSAVTVTETETSSTTGIYTADLANGGALAKVADIATLVPDPNTITYGQSLAKFSAFPSYARVDFGSTLVGFAATHPPLLQLSSGRGGSAGLYANPGSVLDTGLGLFAVDPYSFFQIPDMTAGTAFGAVPNSPAMVNGSTMVFKGDYVLGTTVGMGIYYRDVVSSGGESPVVLIASNRSTVIPTKFVKFGYIGAPSAVADTVVFVGYDKKDAPTAGGIYSAPISDTPALTPLVKIGQAVPGETDTFTGFSDALSFDGRFVAFWGSWGSATNNVHITCPTDGDAATNAYCLTIFPNGYDAQVPVHQGMFVYDTQDSSLTALAKTGSEFSSFAYYVFVGIPPEGDTSGGGGGETEVVLEPPAFVLSPNIAVTTESGARYRAVFKANTGTVDGLYLASGPDNPSIETVADTTMTGAIIDTAAPSTSTIIKLELERESMRGGWLTIGSTMLDGATQTTVAGVYAAGIAVN